MSAPEVRIEPSRPTVQPGGQVRVVLSVMNTGTIVEGYRVEVVDEVSGRSGRPDGPQRWAEVLVPDDEGNGSAAEVGPVVSVFPGAQREVTVVFSAPPGSQAASGGLAFGVRAQSVVEPSSSAVAEGVLEVGQVSGLQARLAPVTSSGRWTGRHNVQVSNWGNAPVSLRLEASDPDLQLGFLVRPDHLDIPLGGTASARIKVRTRKPRLRGPATRVPFSLSAATDLSPVWATSPTSADAESVRIDGAFTQKPIAKGLVPTLGLVLVLVAAAAGWVATHPVDVPTRSGTTAVPPPTISAVTADSDTALTVAWGLVPGATAYDVLTLEKGTPTAKVTVQAPVVSTLITELTGNTEYCFQVVTLRGQAASRASASVCATTKAPAVEVPVFAAAQWIAVVQALPATQDSSEASATDTQAELKRAGLPSGRMLSTSFPEVAKKFSGTESWLVYVGPYASQVEADAQCRQAPKALNAPCITIQPAGAGATTPPPTPPATASPTATSVPSTPPVTAPTATSSS